MTTQELPKAKPLNMGGVVAAIPQRRLSQETCGRFGVTVEYSSTGEIQKHFYPYYNTESGEICAAKVRDVKTKGFHATGDMSGAGFFGQQQCSGNKYITITEGELDALSVYEMFNKQYDVVSLRSGASNAAKEIKEQLEWLESYENIVICFDNDKAGDAALEQVKDLFSPNKLKICKLPVKDASDMLMANRVKDFTQLWWNAKVYRPDGIVAGTETWDALVEKRQVKSIPYPWEGLNHITRGHRPYELVTITRIWPEQRLVSCRWRQTGPFTWKRTRLWTNFDRFGRPHWAQDVTTYLTIGGQRRLITSSPVFDTWQKHLTAGTSYWTTCPSSSLPKSQGTKGRPLTKS
jgi:twinkle protein